MKPDWKDAPEWAEFLAMHRDGEYYWYSEKPHACISYWNHNRGSMVQYAEIADNAWLDTLEKRP